MTEQPPEAPGPNGPSPGGPSPAGPSMAGAIWAGVGGIFVNVPISLVVVLAQNGSAGVGTIIFAVLVFVGGGALCFVKSRPTRGFAVGLMIGWALLSITTAGFCTGLADLRIG